MITVLISTSVQMNYESGEQHMNSQNSEKDKTREHCGVVVVNHLRASCVMIITILV